MRPVAVTVGTFDGVHLGHRRLLATAAALAAEAGLELVALTLDRHPLALLHPERAPLLLTGLDHKLELLAGVPGVARAEVLVFDRRRAEQAPESFLADTLVGEFGARLLVVGGNFRFGRGGTGDVALAEDLGARVGLRVVGMTLVEGAPGSVISSSAIRRLVAEGHLARAEALLGRPHEIRGTLGDPSPPGDGVPADGGARGTEVVVAADLLLPPPGRYEVRAGPLGEAAPALVASIRPPGAPSPVVLEVPPGQPVTAGWVAGTRVRVAFEAAPPPSPVGARPHEEASGRAGDR